MGVGEPPQRLAEMREGLQPLGEFALMKEGMFSRVLSMAELGMDPASAMARLRFALWACGATGGCEAVLLAEEFPGIEYLACNAILGPRQRIALLIHNVSSRRRQIPLGRLRLIHRADRVLCLSPYSRGVLVERYGVPEAKVRVVYSRVDTDFFRPDPGPSRRHIASAGAVNRDYRTLVEAVSGLDVDVKIAVDSPWRYSIGEPDHLAGLPPNVEMRSWGTYRELRRLYAESAFVVVPLKRRQLVSGITVTLEAMAMGRAVILSRNPYVEGFIEHGETGFYVEPGNVEQLRETIVRLLEQPDLAEAVGRKARRRAEERFSVNAYLERLIAPVHELA